MFNADEFDGKQKIENSTDIPKTIFTNIEDGKVIYVYNTRTRDMYKIALLNLLRSLLHMLNIQILKK